MAETLELADLTEVMRGLCRAGHWSDRNGMRALLEDGGMVEQGARTVVGRYATANDVIDGNSIRPKRKVRAGYKWRIGRKSDREDLFRTRRYIISPCRSPDVSCIRIPPECLLATLVFINSSGTAERQRNPSSVCRLTFSRLIGCAILMAAAFFESQAPGSCCPEHPSPG